MIRTNGSWFSDRICEEIIQPFVLERLLKNVMHCHSWKFGLDKYGFRLQLMQYYYNSSIQLHTASNISKVLKQGFLNWRYLPKYHYVKKIMKFRFSLGFNIIATLGCTKNIKITPHVFFLYLIFLWDLISCWGVAEEATPTYRKNISVLKTVMVKKM